MSPGVEEPGIVSPALLGRRMGHELERIEHSMQDLKLKRRTGIVDRLQSCPAIGDVLQFRGDGLNGDNVGIIIFTTSLPVLGGWNRSRHRRGDGRYLFFGFFLPSGIPPLKNYIILIHT